MCFVFTCIKINLKPTGRSVIKNQTGAVMPKRQKTSPEHCADHKNI